MKPNLFSGRTAAAFTLLELAVVLATFGLLAAVLLPALAATRNDSKTFRCQQNLRQLANAWLMYADENSERLVNLCTYVPYSPTSMTSANAPWRAQISLVSVNLPADLTANTLAAQRYLVEMGYKQPSNTGQKIINGPLYPYAPNVDVVHCPADFRCNLRFGAGYSGPYAWDSYSGVSGLNGDAYTPLTKRTQLRHPSDRITWAEGGDMRGENLGSWNFNTALSQFADSPAAFHVAAANFNFCDGHVELHPWQDPTTINWANEISSLKDIGDAAASAANHTGNVDAIWVGSHYPGPLTP